VLVSLGLPLDRHGDPGLFTADGIATVSLAAEAAGFAAVFTTDHPAPDTTWLASGGHRTVDPFVALSFAAAATTSLRVHTNLLVLGYRNPLLAAKSVATLDLLSGGRTIVGVGVGYLPSEFNALGADFANRAVVADEALDTMVQAWHGLPMNVVGRNWEAVDTVVEPTPVQQPHPPLWVGGNSVAAMRRAVRFGDAWAPMPSPQGSATFLGTPAMPGPDALATGVRRLRELSAEAGRVTPPGVVAIPTSVTGMQGRPWEAGEVIDDIGALVEAGATGLVVNLPGQSVEEFCHQLDLFSSSVLDRI
jgi:probable F420-dependent oxidoreductase